MLIATSLPPPSNTTVPLPLVSEELSLPAAVGHWRFDFTSAQSHRGPATFPVETHVPNCLENVSLTTHFTKLSICPSHLW